MTDIAALTCTAPLDLKFDMDWDLRTANYFGPAEIPDRLTVG